MVYKTRSTGGAALPGCAADGKTFKETLASVEIIIQEWIRPPFFRALYHVTRSGDRPVVVPVCIVSKP